MRLHVFVGFCAQFIVAVSSYRPLEGKDFYANVRTQTQSPYLTFRGAADDLLAPTRRFHIPSQELFDGIEDAPVALRVECAKLQGNTTDLPNAACFDEKVSVFDMRKWASARSGATNVYQVGKQTQTLSDTIHQVLSAKEVPTARAIRATACHLAGDLRLCHHLGHEDIKLWEVSTEIVSSNPAATALLTVICHFQLGSGHVKGCHVMLPGDVIIHGIDSGAAASPSVTSPSPSE